jgi:DNA-binding MarR family transcriptional regulator
VSSYEEAVREVRSATVDLLVAIRQASLGRGHRRSLLEATGMDLTGTERWILHAIPGHALVPIGQVAASLGVALPAVSRACTRLVEAGHLVRLPDPRDRRRILVGLTEQATDALSDWAASWPVGYLEAVDDWRADEIGALDEWLRMVATHVLHAPTPATPRASPRSATSPAAHLVHFRATIETMVPAAGRFDLVASEPSDEAPPLTDGIFQALVLIARSQGLLQSEIAAQTDTDPALTRRRVKSLLDLGLVQLTPSPTTSTRRCVTATAAGHEAVETVLASHAASMPDTPEHLLEAGLHRLVRRYNDHLASRQEQSGDPTTPS